MIKIIKNILSSRCDGSESDIRVDYSLVVYYIHIISVHNIRYLYSSRSMNINLRASLCDEC